MRFRRLFVAVAVAALSTAAFAADSPERYADARALWEQTKDKTEYRAYAAEFAQFNNHFHLDEKDGCYGRASGRVSLMLVISRRDGDEFASVANVLSDVDNAKARCFKRTYTGVRTKAPPFLPFVLQMDMG